MGKIRYIFDSSWGHSIEIWIGLDFTISINS